MSILVNISGKFFKRDQAMISVFDRGFLYGDSVFEVIRTFNGKPFAMKSHLKRLSRSRELTGMEVPWDDHFLSSQIEDSISRAQNPESYIRLILTRGQGEFGLHPRLAADPLYLVLIRPWQEFPDSYYNQGVNISISPVRRNLVTALNPQIKSGNYLNNILAIQPSEKSRIIESVMLDYSGYLTEGSTSNIFLIKEGEVVTPPLEIGLLQGITRNVVFELCSYLNIPIREERLVSRDLLEADAAFITSTLKGIMPVKCCDDQIVGTGEPGPIIQNLLKYYHRLTWDQERFVEIN